MDARNEKTRKGSAWKGLRLAAGIALGLPLLFVGWHTLVRIVRHFYKFPMPEFLANLIDNPLRRRIQPPEEMAIRHGLEPGTWVLEVGPGNGTYTLAAARRVGPAGRVVAVDIEPRMVERVLQKAEAEGVQNVDARVADVTDLPFDDEAFDAAYMITVVGEIPDPVGALRELRRVLAPAGTLACSEVLLDPDYPLASTLLRWAEQAGFRLREKRGNVLLYTLLLDKG
ncbi:MAG TPA: class I SAM-dependent methyltransferase [Anaerolineae bacterium]|nr:class I SAM-dependent methyltransferase [Anaerolineae bacterium]